MPSAKFIAMAICGLVAVCGCSQTATDEPQKLDARVEQSAEPMPIARPAAGGQKPVEPQPVQQAAFADTADGDASGPAEVPPVLLTKQHQELCRVKVGDTLPAIELPKVLGGNAKLSALAGKAATVVVFWKADRRMSRDELADLGPDVVQKFGSRGVEVVGIAVEEPAATARDLIKKTAANFPQLLDADGKAFAQVGAERLPWTLVLDGAGKIVWFDLEYSLSTRRELQQALLATLR
jgi:peroxiredoxin